MGGIASWTQPIAAAIDFLRAGFRAAIETGDLTFACFCMFMSVTDLLLRNDPLDAVWRESEMALDFVRKPNSATIGRHHRKPATLHRDHAGPDRNLLHLQRRAVRRGDVRGPAHRAECPCDLLYWMLKLKARFLSGDYAEALAAAGKAKPLLPDAASPVFAAGLLLLRRIDGGGAV